MHGIDAWDNTCFGIFAECSDPHHLLLCLLYFQILFYTFAACVSFVTEQQQQSECVILCCVYFFCIQRVCVLMMHHGEVQYALLSLCEKYLLRFFRFFSPSPNQYTQQREYTHRVLSAVYTAVQYIRKGMLLCVKYPEIFSSFFPVIQSAGSAPVQSSFSLYTQQREWESTHSSRYKKYVQYTVYTVYIHKGRYDMYSRVSTSMYM